MIQQSWVVTTRNKNKNSNIKGNKNFISQLTISNINEVRQIIYILKKKKDYKNNHYNLKTMKRSRWIKRFHISWSSRNRVQGLRKFEAWYVLSWEAAGLALYCTFLPSLLTLVVGTWYWPLSFDPYWKTKLCQMWVFEKERLRDTKQVGYLKICSQISMHI